MISRLVVVSPVKAILAMRGEEASGLPHSPEAVDDVQNARQQVGDQVHPEQDRGQSARPASSTSQLPAASAGASFQQAISSGNRAG